ncbi:hypothetical protein HPB52_012251 [Rhipicephalus sanguineus]|uniref:Uncharacterized protein n=1 Tax=Rhipicephalus sanguineus TaxID=34632 RepID=A0A9D4PZN8_RHISA|nr:hypothetical protein HPB52_012251 [Rhipicephalus sanguineus]
MWDRQISALMKMFLLKCLGCQQVLAVANCFRHSGFCAPDESPGTECEAEVIPAGLRDALDNVSFDDYVDVDNSAVVCGTITDDDIIAQVTGGEEPTPPRQLFRPAPSDLTSFPPGRHSGKPQRQRAQRGCARIISTLHASSGRHRTRIQGQEELSKSHCQYRGYVLDLCQRYFPAARPTFQYQTTTREKHLMPRGAEKKLPNSPMLLKNHWRHTKRNRKETVFRPSKN